MRTIGTATLVVGLLAAPLAGQSARADSRAARRTPVVDVFERTRDAVVNIAASQVLETTSPFGLFDDVFGRPFGDSRAERYRRTSLGSGAVIHPDGYVVTNAHVVVRAAEIKVIFADKSEHAAEKVAADENHDLAVLKIEADHPLPAITLGRSDDLMIGETVIAIGNPLGYQHTVTTGIVSATERDLTVSENLVYEDLIQTDASINRGNSGGPLLNVLGELIGINTAIRGDAQNIGFAIPVDRLRELLPDMLSTERLRRLTVGLKFSRGYDVTVVSVAPPSDKAGIEVGDEVLGIDGAPVEQDLDIYVRLLRAREAQPMRFELKRQERRFTATVAVAAIPIPDGRRLLEERFGMSVRQITEREARELDLKEGLIVVTEVASGSPAARLDITPGLIIVQIGKYYPTGLDDVGLLLENVHRGDKVLFKFWRIGTQFIREYVWPLTAR